MPDDEDVLLPCCCSWHRYTDNNTLLNLVMDFNLNEPLVKEINKKTLSYMESSSSQSSSSRRSSGSGSGRNISTSTGNSSNGDSRGNSPIGGGLLDASTLSTWETNIINARARLVRSAPWLNDMRTDGRTKKSSSSDNSNTNGDNSSSISSSASSSSSRRGSLSKHPKHRQSPATGAVHAAHAEAVEALNILNDLLDNRGSPKVLIPTSFSRAETQEALASFLSDIPTEELPVEDLFRVALAKLQLDPRRKPLTLE